MNGLINVQGGKSSCAWNCKQHTYIHRDVLCIHTQSWDLIVESDPFEDASSILLFLYIMVFFFERRGQFGEDPYASLDFLFPPVVRVANRSINCSLSSLFVNGNCIKDAIASYIFCF